MRGLSIQELTQVTKLSPRVLMSIERGDLAALPPGIHGRAHLRTYAHAVGLDPAEVVAIFGERVPAPPDPLDALRDVVDRRFAADHPMAAALQSSARSLQRRAEHTVRTRLWSRARTARGARHACAHAIDGGVLAGSGLTMLIAAAWLTGAPANEVWRSARWPFAASFALTTFVYFIVSQSVAGRSPGMVCVTWLSRPLEQRPSQSEARGHAS